MVTPFESWNELKAKTAAERYVNDMAGGVTRFRTMGFPIPSFSPTVTPAGSIAMRQFQALLERYVDFDHPRNLTASISEQRQQEIVLPALLVSAIDVLNGRNCSGPAARRPTPS